MTQFNHIMKSFAGDFKELVNRNHLHDTKVSEMDLYRMELVNYPNYVRIKIEYRGDENVYFPMVYRYAHKDKITADENCFVNIIKEELNFIIERFQTLLEEL